MVGAVQAIVLLGPEGWLAAIVWSRVDPLYSSTFTGLPLSSLVQENGYCLPGEHSATPVSTRKRTPAWILGSRTVKGFEVPSTRSVLALLFVTSVWKIPLAWKRYSAEVFPVGSAGAAQGQLPFP